MKKLIIITVAAFSIFIAQDYSYAEAINNGRDVTRPLARFDTSYQYQDMVKGHAEHTFTIRTDKPFCMAPGWEIAVRADLPCVLTNKITSNEPGKDFNFGLGDVLTQILLVRHEGDMWAFAAGTQMIFPTGSTTQMGMANATSRPNVPARRSSSTMRPEVHRLEFQMPIIPAPITAYVAKSALPP